MQTHLPQTWRVATLLVAVSLTALNIAHAVQLDSVSALAPAAGGGGDSVAPVLTADGRYVLFTSVANNLALNTNGTPYRGASGPRLNVFLRDRTGATTTLVSVNTNGNSGGKGDSIGTDVSTNGQFALFESSAGDLAPNDTNNLNDVFVRDLVLGTTRLVSVATNGRAGNAASRGSAMTPDGRYVAFVSLASNLVSGDNNGIADVFVADLVSNTMTLASVGAMPTNSTGTCEAPLITADGRFVAFYSSATNLVPGVTAVGDLYVRDLVAGTTYWASVHARAALGTNNVLISNHALSEDGKTVAFRVAPASGAAAGVIVRYNWETDVTNVIASANTQPGSDYEGRRTLDMTPDGRFIAFVANSNQLTTSIRISLWDGLTEQITPASDGVTNYFSGDAICGWPTVDPSGRYVAFIGSGSNSVATNTSLGSYHLYVKDMQLGTTRLISKSSNGVPSPGGVSFSTLSRLSTNGQFIAFQAADGNLVPNDSNRAEDVFVHDLLAETTTLISVHDPALPSETPVGPSGSPGLSISADGRFVAFASLADNVALNDTNKCIDVFARDVVAGINYMVSVATNGWSPTNANSTEASISADGRYVAFTSGAGNLVTNDSSNLRDVFVRDLLSGTTKLVSVRSNSAPPIGNWESYQPVISADGQRVLFLSMGFNLAPVPPSPPTQTNLFYRDLQAGTTMALTTATNFGLFSLGMPLSVSMTPDGRWVAFITASGTARNLYLWDAQTGTRVYTNSTAGLATVSISPNGSRLAYTTNNSSVGQLFVADWAAKTNWPVGAMLPSIRAGMRFSADGRYLTYAGKTALTSPDTNATYDVYLYDLQTRSNRLVSHRFAAPDAANDASDTPDISPDGRFVAYRSFATNIIAGDDNAVGDAFLYDRTTDTSTLLSLSRFDGGPADSWSFPPQFTRDGHQVVFQSWASDLAGLDFNLNSDVFGYAMFYVNLAPGGLPTSGPTLSWPVEAGKTYQVEYLDDLNLNNWQNAGGTVTILNGWAYFTDPAPSPNQRHYRIVAN